MQRLRHPATIIASLALFIALGGGAALASGLISGSQIKNHSIPVKKLTKSATKSLRGERGAPGPAGAPGAAGKPGPIGPSSATSVYNDGVTFGKTYTVVASLALSAGSYLVLAKTNVYDPTAASNFECALYDTSAAKNIDNNYTNDQASSDWGMSLNLQAPLTTTGTTVQMRCVGTDTNAKTYATQLAAIKLGSVSGS